MHPTRLPWLSGWPPPREMLIVLLGTALLILSGFLFQGRISIGNGLGWDGVAYANMAVNPQQIPNAPASDPYRLRVLLPLLVHYAGPFPNVADNFWLLNLIFATLYSVGVYALLGMAFPNSHAISRLLMWFILNAGEQGPIRTTFFYPALTDTLANLLFLVLLAVLLLARGGVLSAIGVSIVFFFGVLTRENFVANLGLVVLVSLIEIRRDKTQFRVLLHAGVPRWLRVAGAMAGIALAVLYIRSVWHLEFVTGNMQAFVEGHATSRVFAVLSMVYGPFILLYLAARNQVKICPSVYPVAMFFACSLAAVLRGGNIERYLFWNSITLAVLTFPYLEHLICVRAYFRLSVILLHFAVVQRVFVPIASAISTDPLLTAGCDARKYVLGASPHLGYWTTFCGGSAPLPFLVAFAVCAALIWAAQIRKIELVRSPAISRV